MGIPNEVRALSVGESDVLQKEYADGQFVDDLKIHEVIPLNTRGKKR